MMIDSFRFLIVKSPMEVVFISKPYDDIETMEEESVNEGDNGKYDETYYCIQLRDLDWNGYDKDMAYEIYKHKLNDDSQDMTDKMCDLEQRANCEVFVC